MVRKSQHLSPFWMLFPKYIGLLNKLAMLPLYIFQCPAVIIARESKDSNVSHHHCRCQVYLPGLNNTLLPRSCFLSQGERTEVNAFERDGTRQHVNMMTLKQLNTFGQVSYRLILILPAPFCKLRTRKATLFCTENVIKAPLLQPCHLLKAKETKRRKWLCDTYSY